MLQFDTSWRFTSPGPIPRETSEAIWTLMRRVLSQTNAQATIEHFKRHFAGAAGEVAHVSSSSSWAISDLRTVFDEAALNAPLFLEAFYEGCQELAQGHAPLTIPPVELLNRTLAETNAGFQYDPPTLRATRDYEPVAVGVPPQSLEAAARSIIEQSLQESDRLLKENRPRQAVLEILWLMESIITAFRGVEVEMVTVEGKYFNVIAKELRASATGTTLSQALKWLTELHGYLSSPTGGGLRHGVDIKAGLTLSLSEARLYCNLMRSYISFLLDEHERLAGKP